MDPRDLYQQFLRSAARCRRGTVLKSCEFVRVGPSSIAVIPYDQPDTIVKILKEGRTPYGLGVAEEFEMLSRLQGLEGRYFTIPEPVSFGHDPSYIQMKRLGESIPPGPVTDSDVARVGRAFGEFSARLFTEHDAIHGDIHLGNATFAPDGRIGIIDIASIQTRRPVESIFIFPLLSGLNLSPFIADEFERRTGRTVDLRLVGKLLGKQIQGQFRVMGEAQAAPMRDNAVFNLKRWKAMKAASGSTAFRPCGAGSP